MGSFPTDCDVPYGYGEQYDRRQHKQDCSEHRSSPGRFGCSNTPATSRVCPLYAETIGRLSDVHEYGAGRSLLDEYVEVGRHRRWAHSVPPDCSSPPSHGIRVANSLHIQLRFCPIVIDQPFRRHPHELSFTDCLFLIAALPSHPVLPDICFRREPAHDGVEVLWILVRGRLERQSHSIADGEFTRSHGYNSPMKTRNATRQRSASIWLSGDPQTDCGSLSVPALLNVVAEPLSLVQSTQASLLRC
jgi:hypothetical protein